VVLGEICFYPTNHRAKSATGAAPDFEAAKAAARQAWLELQLRILEFDYGERRRQQPATA
jgi:hypothetical protein